MTKVSAPPPDACPLPPLLADSLRQAGVPFVEGKLLSAATTFGVGGPADGWAEPGTVVQVQAVLRACREASFPAAVVGKGANLLASDAGFRGMVIHLSGSLKGLRLHGDRLTAGGGAVLRKASALTVRAGLAGMEKLAGIPSSIGGALAMNAGCYGQEIGEVVEWVLASDWNGNLRQFKADDLKFGYRTSPLRGPWLILYAGLKLKPAPPGAVKEDALAILRRRRDTLPWGRSAGSVFKNPPGMKARELIARCGLAGTRTGGAWLHDRHTNTILNTGGSSAADIAALIALIQNKVESETGIRLEPEVQQMGF
jgi:UDP-N-acetylmuramate dehydrogenase